MRALSDAKPLRHLAVPLLLLCLALPCVLPAGLPQESAIIGHSQSPTLHEERSPKVASLSPSLRPPHVPVYRIPLRVHLHKSGRSATQFRGILEEINAIWWSQAGICFEMHTVETDKPLEQGLDLWFLPVIGGDDQWNGLYRNDQDMQVRDTPRLEGAPNPARHPAARTAAHELGHALGLQHRQESDDNLMRSKTFGWHLNMDEISAARRTAALKALPDQEPVRCGPPRTGRGE